LHETEAGCRVVRQRVARHDAAVVGREPDRLRLGDQIADGEHQPVVANDDRAARSLGAENRRGERVLGDFRAQHDDRAQRPPEIEANLSRGGLELGGECPIR
jgi:hypothetical protein